MNVLVVGGSGYVGGAVVDLLEEAGEQVRVYDALLYEECYRKPVEFERGDVRDHARLFPHLEWADVVIWLAAVVGDGACALNPELTVEVNQEAVGWLAEHFKKRIVFLSTCSVYGARDGILDESSPTNPLSVYAVTKLQAEQYLEGSDAIVFRLGTLYGVGDLFSRIRLDLVVNVLTARAHRFGKVMVFGGLQHRPLLHVKDSARAVVNALTGGSCGVYNLAGENMTIIELAERVEQHFPGLVVERTERKFEDTRNYRVSGDRAVTELGFRPRFTVDDGILEVRALVESGRLKDLENPRYTNHAYLALEAGRGGGEG